MATAPLRSRSFPHEIDWDYEEPEQGQRAEPEAGPVAAPQGGDSPARTPQEPAAPGAQPAAPGASPTGDHSFEVVVYDQFGQVVPGAAMAFTVDGRDVAATTDASGVATLCGARAATGTVVPASYEKVRELLAPRWSAPPEAADLAVLADAVKVVVGPEMAGVSIESWVRKKIALVRNVVRVRLIGMHFDSGKCFLLPSAMKGIKKVVELYREHPNANLLVVGHTDRQFHGTGDGDAYNLQLSLERADAIAAYLTDDVDAWYKWYQATSGKQWGLTEDEYMLSALPEGGEPYYPAAGKPLWKALHDYQDGKGLERTENPDKKTRQVLIKEYMALDGTTLPAGDKATTHGCGCNFPENTSEGDEADAENRRVEVFVFDGPIVPAPAGEYSSADSPEYGAWKSQVTETIDFSTEAPTPPPPTWVTPVPADAPADQVALVVLSDGVEMARLPLASATQIGNQYSFDLSGLDPANAYRLELRVGDSLIAPPVTIDIAAVRDAILGAQLLALTASVLDLHFA